ncbi:MAG: hypothetical protein OEZ43_01465 [Gammaproteobacteria bacterium]|nr:hypothetical protein [Gammaproteobacteria bacterium]
MQAITFNEIQFEGRALDVAREAVRIRYGTAIIWLKEQVDAQQRDQIITRLMNDAAVVDVFFMRTKPSLLNVEFRIDRVSYDRLIEIVRQVDANANIVGY